MKIGIGIEGNSIQNFRLRLIKYYKTIMRDSSEKMDIDSIISFLVILSRELRRHLKYKKQLKREECLIGE